MAVPDTTGERRETGRVLIVGGWVVLIVDSLILFFFPSAERIGDDRAFMALIGGLAVIAFGMIGAGYLMRNRAARRM